MSIFSSFARACTILLMLSVGFTIFHSSNASALIQIVSGGCTFDPDTGTLTCTTIGGGDSGGGSCDIPIFGGGGPGGAVVGGGMRQVGIVAAAKPDKKLIGELAKKLASEYQPPWIAQNENGSVYVAKAIADCTKYVADGI